jgi:Cu+-exporting ATPase
MSNADGPGAQSNSLEHLGAIYTCPMHPEVRQDHPGVCPICGTALELVQAASHEENAELREMPVRFQGRG